MAKDTKTPQNRILLIVIIALVAFSLGFVIARARYKSQLKTTFNMVMEKDAAVTNLKMQMKNLEGKLKMTEEKMMQDY